MLAGIALAAAVLGVGVALAGAGGDGAPDGVRVAGVDVAGLGRDEIARVVRRRARELMSRPVEIVRADDADYRLRVTPRSLRARPQVRRAVDRALDGRGLGGRLMSLVGLGETRDIPIEFTLDRGAVGEVVGDVTRGLNTPARAAALEVTDDDIVVRRSAVGFGVDPRALRERIARLPERIELELGPLAPAVGDAAAEAAREQALAIVAQPVEVTLQGKGVTIEPEVLRSALRFQPRPPELRVLLDPAVLYEDIAPAFETREREARDATFVVSGSSVRLVPSRIGRSLDMQAIAAAITSQPGTAAVRARFKVTKPGRTTAQARALRITEQVAEYTTPYSCCEPRVQNIQRAAELLDGYVIPAGGRFSLNDALGRRTEERGFVAAPQIAAGRLEDAVGGGVSQVATTMFNAAFFAGLAIVDHTPHQFWISRYPQGREATVSFGGPELIVDNDWDAAVLIDATATDSAITIRLFSSPLGRRVETETSEQTNIVQPEIHETVDDDLEPGERVVEQEMGGPGFTVTYTRTVWAGSELKRDETYTWTYDAQDAYVRVGPDAPEPEPDEPRRQEPRTDRGGTTREQPAPTAPRAPARTDGGGAPPATSSGGPAPPPPGT